MTDPVVRTALLATDGDGAPVVPPDLDAVRRRFAAEMPFSSTLGVECVELSAERAVLRLPDRSYLHNQAGGPHGGAMFTLGDSAAAAITMAGFGDLLPEYIPFLADATIRYETVAMGPVIAEGRLSTPTARVRSDIAAHRCAEFEVDIEFRTRSGTVTSRMTARIVLVRARTSGPTAD